MAKKKEAASNQMLTRSKPAEDDDARLQQLIGYAYDRAEQQLIDGTASSQVITHFLKLGTERTKLENEKIKKETALIDSKKINIDMSTNHENDYLKAIEAFKIYSGNEEEVDYSSIYTGKKK